MILERTAVLPPKIAATRSNWKKPQRPQLRAPTTTKILQIIPKNFIKHLYYSGIFSLSEKTAFDYKILF